MVQISSTKECSLCRNTKHISLFYRHDKTSYESRCKDCYRATRKKKDHTYYLKNREKKIEQVIKNRLKKQGKKFTGSIKKRHRRC